MRSHVFDGMRWALGDGTPADPTRLHINRAGRAEQAAPLECHKNHPLGPDRVLVGGGAQGLTWRCVQCNDVVHRPPRVHPGRA
ncbi:hypothetical protein GCM10027262_75020 [Nocardia tengchongensis]